jgi:hypothetical protein
MAMFTCPECSIAKSQGYVKKCNRCGRLLCDKCRGPFAVCKSSKRAKTTGCNGTFLRVSAPQMA